MKPFDDQFADNVRKAFDAWQEEMPPQAWDAMKARLDGQGKARVLALWPFLAKAAGVALLVGMSVFGYVHISRTSQMPVLAEQPIAQGSPAEAPADSGVKATVAETFLLFPERETMTEARPATPEAAPARRKYARATQTQSLALQTEAEEDTLLMAETETPGLAAELVAESQAVQETEPEVPTLALRPATDPGQVAGQVPASRRPAQPIAPEKSTDERRLSWGVTAGSMVAFAENRVSDMPGYTAGVLAEYALSDNVSLSSGGVFTYHQFELVNFANADFAYDYLPAFDDMSSVNLTGNNQYEMLAFEIPLNAQFNVMETGKRRLYVGAGLSSLVYLQQRFTGVNRAFYQESFFNDATGMVEVHYAASTFTVDEEYGPLSRFDFGRLLNLSLGYVIRREKSAVVIEPFVKLPIGTLTSRDINLGMGGVSLKYRFSGN